MTTFVFTIALITINELLQFVPLNALWGLTTFLCTIAIDNCCMLYSNCGIFYVVISTSRSSAIMIITTTIP